MLFEHVNVEDTSPRPPQSQESETQDANTAPPAAAPAVETSRPVSLARTRSQVAATAAEARAAVNSTRGIGDAVRAQAMQQASQASSSRHGDAPFGASRSWKLREALTRARFSKSHDHSPASACSGFAASFCRLRTTRASQHHTLREFEQHVLFECHHSSVARRL